MSAHTPGPWLLNGVMAMDTPLWIVSIPGEQARIEVADYSAESEGNARLIAAAPDLLAALEQVLALSPHFAIAVVCNSAIAKARGDK